MRVSPQFPAPDGPALVAFGLDMILYGRHDFEVRIAKTALSSGNRTSVNWLPPIYKLIAVRCTL
jgi:hypothetical protein